MPVNFNQIITTELQKFNVTDTAIAHMKEKYMSLSIDGIDDNDGYNAVKSSRMDVKKKRTEVEKVRKELKEDSLVYGRKVDSEAKRITSLLIPIEDYLEELQQQVDEKKGRIKQEKQKAREELVQSRIDKFQKLGKRIEYSILSLMNEETFSAALEKATTEFNAEQERIKKEAGIERIKREAEEILIRQERARIAEENRIESERLDKIAKQQKAERKKLEEQAIEIAKKEAAIKAGQDRIEAIALNERREKEESQRRGLLEEQEKLRLKQEEAHKEFLKPDKEKLMGLSKKYLAIQKPEMQSPEARDALSMGLQFINRGIKEWQLFGELP